MDIQAKFREYYRGGLVPPIKTEEREFGVGSAGKKISARHLAFAGPKELHEFLVNEAPLYISHSISYYEFPDARPMERKGWLGADLVFDLDADDIPCEKKHVEHWFCEECLENVKQETLKLIDVLQGDFGIKKSDLKLIFSGNKGYHIHIRTPEVMGLDGNARKEIVDYVRFEDIKGIRYESSIAHKIRALDGQKLDKRSGGKINRITKRAVQAYSVRIDRSVTADLSKLIRMPDSLHGSTGFKVRYIGDLEKFDPFRDAVVFGDKETEILADCPKFTLKDREFGPFKKERVKLPEYAAIYLILKGRGEEV